MTVEQRDAMARAIDAAFPRKQAPKQDEPPPSE
jgi:hypothetical protein